MKIWLGYFLFKSFNYASEKRVDIIYYRVIKNPLVCSPIFFAVLCNFSSRKFCVQILFYIHSFLEWLSKTQLHFLAFINYFSKYLEYFICKHAVTGDISYKTCYNFLHNLEQRKILFPSWIIFFWRHYFWERHYIMNWLHPTLTITEQLTLSHHLELLLFSERFSNSILNIFKIKKIITWFKKQ